MTIKELKEKLNEFPDDLPVVTNDYLGMFNVGNDDIQVTSVPKSHTNCTNLPEGTKVLAL